MVYFNNLWRLYTGCVNISFFAVKEINLAQNCNNFVFLRCYKGRPVSSQVVCLPPFNSICSNRCYDNRKQICCHDNVTNQYQIHSRFFDGYRCCGSEAYFEGVQSCCNTNLYNTEEHGCINGRLKPLMPVKSISCPRACGRELPRGRHGAWLEREICWSDKLGNCLLLHPVTQAKYEYYLEMAILYF